LRRNEFFKKDFSKISKTIKRRFGEKEVSIFDLSVIVDRATKNTRWGDLLVYTFLFNQIPDDDPVTPDSTWKTLSFFHKSTVLQTALKVYQPTHPGKEDVKPLIKEGNEKEVIDYIENQYGACDAEYGFLELLDEAQRYMCKPTALNRRELSRVIRAIYGFLRTNHVYMIPKPNLTLKKLK